MPVYKADEMKATPDVKNPNVLMKQFGGDLIKVGIVTYKTGETPPPHYHPNDEQWVFMLEGRVAHLMGDEIITIGGHLDSWDVGQGAHDDGAGCMQSIHVLRLFQKL